MTTTTPLRANFQGSAPRGRPAAIAGAAAERMDGYWSSVSRYSRRASRAEPGGHCDAGAPAGVSADWSP